MKKGLRLLLIICLGLTPIYLQEYGVESLEIKEKKDVGKKPFLEGGLYELLKGKVTYIIDPEHKLNQTIADIKFAQKDKDSKVRYSADFIILKPKDMKKSNGILLYEVVNRGNPYYKLMTGEGWDRGASQPQGGGSYTRLFQQGYTLVLSGWQGDIEDDAKRLKARFPLAIKDGKCVPGQSLYEFYADKGDTSHKIGERGIIPYPVDHLKKGEMVLRKHRGYENQGDIVDQKLWSISKEGDRDVVHYPDGFPEGVYTLTYQPLKAPVMGLGLSAVRDLVDFLKSDSKNNPLISRHIKNPIQWSFAKGSSQCGRFLNTFLYQGFNESLSGRKTFDGIFNQLPGARKVFLNYRFSQPSRYKGFYPNYDFPFSYGASQDSVLNKNDGILKKVSNAFMPKIMVIHHSAEYWSSGSAFTHASVNSQQDLKIPDSVRIYHMTGTAHGSARLKDGAPIRGRYPRYYLDNPNFSSALTSPLFDQLVNWVKSNQQPESSSIPTFENGQLVWIENYTFPETSEFIYPRRTPKQPRYNYGPRFHEGIISNPLPEIGKSYPLYVPKVDKQGNELSGLKSPLVAVPLASYTGWNVSRGWNKSKGPSTLKYQSGAWLPFAATKAERLKNEDSRLSVEELYGSKEKYLSQLNQYMEQLISKKLLLKADQSRLSRIGSSMYDHIMKKK